MAHITTLNFRFSFYFQLIGVKKYEAGLGALSKLGHVRHGSALKKGTGIEEEMFQEAEAGSNSHHNWKIQEEKGELVVPVKSRYGSSLP